MLALQSLQFPSKALDVQLANAKFSDYEKQTLERITAKIKEQLKELQQIDQESMQKIPNNDLDCQIQRLLVKEG